MVVATRSAHKMREIRRILTAVPELRVLDLDEAGVAYDPVEEGVEAFDTFEANARAKAEYFHGRTSLPTVADDSGLEVDALDGAPGVWSKRFAPDEGLEGEARDEANNRHLVRLLEGTPTSGRTARYVCVAVLAGMDPGRTVFRGEAPGVILDHPRGRGGFGYDPYFFDPELGKTFAEISRDEKNARSHRGRAFRALADTLGESHR
ncbi:MAG: non-canonical purine NTP pyrophosphatase [Gemmatimonadota bacterium]